MVDYVVAMRAAGARREKGRRVEMADAEGFQIRHERRGIVEGEGCRQLQPVRSNRNTRGHQDSPIAQCTDQGLSSSAAAPPQIGRPGSILPRRTAISGVRLATK